MPHGYRTPPSGYAAREALLQARLQRAGRTLARRAREGAQDLAAATLRATGTALRWRPVLWHRAVAAYATREAASLRAQRAVVEMNIVHLEAELARQRSYLVGIDGAITLFERDGTQAQLAQACA